MQSLIYVSNILSKDYVRFYYWNYINKRIYKIKKNNLFKD